MNVLIAPDKFKGSLSANEVCNAIENGLKQFNPSINVVKHPLADGGEGTLDILKKHLNLTSVTAQVTGPLFKPVFAKYLISKTTAYIEMSNASGLQLLEKSEQNCYFTTTFGTGELILDALDKQIKNIVLFIGGSATNDAGIGMAAALGYQFIDKENATLKPIGKELINISKIKNNKLKYKLTDINFTVVCDVKNPLYGKEGAAQVYGKQKGASTKQIAQLDKGLINFSSQVKKWLNKNVSTAQGAGAAGGLGAGALSFLNAKIESGIDFVMEHTGFKDKLHNIDLIITGEGSVDKQTLEGKVIKGISSAAKENNIPFCVLAGIIKDNSIVQKNLNPLQLKAIMDLNIPQSEAIKKAAHYLELLSYDLIKNHNF